VGQVNRSGRDDFAVGTPAVSVWHSTSDRTFAIPTATALGSVPVTVSNTGASRANRHRFTYVETDPPCSRRRGSPSSDGPITCQLFGGVGDHGFLLVAPDASTIPVKGWPLLRNFVVMLPLPLDALGKAQLTETCRPRAVGHSILLAARDEGRRRLRRHQRRRVRRTSGSRASVLSRGCFATAGS
jgi:hypothetical protein